MKQIIFSTILLLCFHLGGAQYLTNDSNATKVKLILQKNCDCALQFAFEREPFGNRFQIKADTFSISLNKAYSGFILHCLDKSQMFDVEYRPEETYTLTGQLCDPDIEGVRLFEVKNVLIKSFPIPEDTDYITNINISTGLEFYYTSKEEMNKAKIYVIHNFKISDLAKLQEDESINTLSKMKYNSKLISDQNFTSKPGDFIYTLNSNQISFYYHTNSPKEYKMLSP